MRYFVLSPEVAGGLGENSAMSRERHPPIVSRLHYEMDVWMGDELLEGFPCFLVTSRLAHDIEQAKLCGAGFDVVELTLSEQFKALDPDRRIPEFAWLRVSGTPGRDDFGADVAGRLVVSEKALRVLRARSLNHCEVAGFQ